MVMTMIRGTVRIYNKKKKEKKTGKEYAFKQAVIYVRSDFLSQLEPYDGKEISLFLSREGSQRPSELEKALVTLFTKAFNDEKIGSLLYSKFEEDVKRILSLLGGRGE